jgi:hypothetical protein
MWASGRLGAIIRLQATMVPSGWRISGEKALTDSRTVANVDSNAALAGSRPHAYGTIDESAFTADPD